MTMEAVLMKSSGDYKHRIGNPKMNFNNNRRPSPSFSSDNFFQTSFVAGGRCAGDGLLQMSPPPLSHSYPSSVSVFRPQKHHNHRGQQPPLLPLPISMLPNHPNINLNISRSNTTFNNSTLLSSSPINKKIKNRARDHSLTPKKSKSQKKDSKKEEGDKLPPAEKYQIDGPTNQRMGPDPKDLPKDITSRVLSYSINNSSDLISVDRFSGSVVFTPSPPPSSLPLPTFSLRPKLSCKGEAATTSGIDAGATDGLRRLLRLR